ncbi:hypothetical protein LUZ60_010068 [Juncus effusus]|nr:hypothetical protein LUZ60_010068 [Juncus effusus]
MNIRIRKIQTYRIWEREYIVIMLILGIVVVVISAVGLVIFWLYRRTFFLNPSKIDNLALYSYAQIKSITTKFSKKLGEGRFGSVFKGKLSDSSFVAVKKLKTVCYEEKQFRSEIQTIGIIQHVNLVRLLGFCAEGTKRLLVYEFMPNGSLNSHIFSNNSEILNWETRYQIVVGIARGLSYLHEECRDCIIHCDIKPENILLDEMFCPKIADFGMAKLLGRDFSRALTTMRGTIGYLAPEWISGQPITQKADVYSFGMMLFEIISGRRNTEKLKNRECTYFPLYAAIKINQGEALCLLDEKLEGNGNTEEIDKACKVACWCIQDFEDDRPTMRQVVQMLEGFVKIEMPPIPKSLQIFVDIEFENDSSYL